MKARRIVRTPPFSWKARIAAFAGIFGIVWLFVSPLPTLGVGSNLLTSWGVWGYLALLVVSGILTIATEYINGMRLAGKMTFVSLSVISTEEGVRHLIEVPQDMRVDTFLELFVKSAGPDYFFAKHPLFDLSLHVNRDGKYVKVSDEVTITEAGLVNGDVCQIHGIIKENYIKRQPRHH